MNSKFRALMLIGVLAALGLVAGHAEAQVPGGLWRFGTNGAYAPQVGNCVSILAMNSSGQTGTDSGTPCAPTVLKTTYTNATTGYTAVLALPAVQGATTLKGTCDLIWESSDTAGTPSFAVQASAAPTDLWVMASVTGGAYVAPTYTVITSTAQTAVASTLTTTGAATPYKLSLAFTLVNGASPNTVTVYAESNNASYTTSVLAGSSCQWIP